MFDCILYSIRPERAPTELEAWAALEAKSETMAADLIRQSHATRRARRRRPQRRIILVAAVAALALAVFWWR